MLPDEIEFIIAKAKLDVELKFNEDQPRDENGRWAETDGGGSSPSEIKASDISRSAARIRMEESKRMGKVISDVTLKAIIQAKGLDGKPQIVQNENELQGTILYRGVTNVETKSADEMVQDFVSGDMFVGKGVFGNGVYFAPDRDLANKYAGDGIPGEGAIITAALSPDSKVFEYYGDRPASELLGQLQELSDNIPRDIFAEHVVGNTDMSRVLALNGYDAIHINASSNAEQYVILNRGAMQVVA